PTRPRGAPVGDRRSGEPTRKGGPEGPPFHDPKSDQMSSTSGGVGGRTRVGRTGVGRTGVGRSAGVGRTSVIGEAEGGVGTTVDAGSVVPGSSSVPPQAATLTVKAAALSTASIFRFMIGPPFKGHDRVMTRLRAGYSRLGAMLNTPEG